jgi:hypothetical protein
MVRTTAGKLNGVANSANTNRSSISLQLAVTTPFSDDDTKSLFLIVLLIFYFAQLWSYG